MFLLTDRLLFGEGRGGKVCLKLNIQSQVGGRTLDVDEPGGWGVFKIGQWISYVYHPL